MEKSIQECRTEKQNTGTDVGTEMGTIIETGNKEHNWTHNELSIL